jgi:threonine/homoserine/homoserine lactone efflux protein
MIGRDEADAAKPPPEEGSNRSDVDSAVQWGVGCLVAAAALVGVVLMVLLLAFYLQPPTWVQVVLGVVLAVGGALLAWLVATALGRSQGESRRREPPQPG